MFFFNTRNSRRYASLLSKLLGRLLFKLRSFCLHFKTKKKNILRIFKKTRIFKNLIFLQNYKPLKHLFLIFIIHKPSLWSRDVPQKIWARSVQPFGRLLDFITELKIVFKKTGQTKPNQTKSNQIKPNQTKSNKPNQTKPNQTKPNQIQLLLLILWLVTQTRIVLKKEILRTWSPWMSGVWNQTSHLFFSRPLPYSSQMFRSGR